MSFEKSSIYVVLVVCLISIYMLFSIKENVVDIKNELTEINSQMQEETDKIHLLKAELAYLTSPSRLKALNEEYIKLGNTSLAQLDNNTDSETDVSAKKTLVARASGDVKWKYKRLPSKYVIMASGKK